MLYNVTSDYQLGSVIARDVAGDSYAIQGVDTETGTQHILPYAIQAVNSQGEGEILVGNMVVGASLSLPFRESFANYELHNWWWSQRIGASSLIPIVYSADDDRGAMRLQTFASGSECAITTPKLLLKGTANPHLSFRYRFTTPPQDAQFFVEVNAGTQRVDTIFTADASAYDEDGWPFVDINLGQDYEDVGYVMISFHLLSHVDATTTLEFDCVNVMDVLSDNVGVSIFAPEVLRAGKEGMVDVMVENLGSDNLVSTADGRPLAFLQKHSFSIPFIPGINDGEEALVRAEVDYAPDEQIDDNVTEEVLIPLQAPTVPAITDLSSRPIGSDVLLSWSAPSTEPENVTDDFEDYAAWGTTYVGDWTMVDGDQGYAAGFARGEYPKQNTPFAYIVYNPYDHEDDMEAIPSFVPHSGNQYLAAFYTFNSYGDQQIPCDNWLISPRLSGNGQTVRFFARGLQREESYEVLYSTASADTASFHLLQTFTTQHSQWNVAGWDEVAVDLPMGTTYFAIRHTSFGQHMFMVDDVSYQREAPASSLLGYHVYRDGVLIATLTGGVSSYYDATADEQSHTYYVTAVYRDGESALSNAVVVQPIPTSVYGMAVGAEPMDVFTLDGKKVRSGATTLHGLRRGVYIVNGQKISVGAVAGE